MLDADDIAAPRRLDRQLQYMENNRNVAVIGTWVDTIDQYGRALSKKKKKYPTNYPILKSTLLFGSCLYHPSIMARRKILLEHPYRPDYEVAQDYDLWVRIARNHTIENLPERLTAYRVHPTQATKYKSTSVESNARAVYFSQLSELGIIPTDTDLMNHALLDKGIKYFRRHFGHDLTVEFLLWAEAWFEKIINANDQQKIYPVKALRSVIVKYWWNICKKASKAIGPKAWVICYRSSLRSNYSLIFFNSL